MAYNLLRDELSVSITEGNFGEYSNAKGRATLAFLEEPNVSGGISSLPKPGDQLQELNTYNVANANAASYTKIICTEVKQIPYFKKNGDGTEGYKYICSFNSEDNVVENNEYHSFSSALSVVSMDKPLNWRYANTITYEAGTAPTSVDTAKTRVQQRISKVVQTGTFKLRKIVSLVNLDTFTEDYNAIAGKLNVDSFYIIDEYDGIFFEQGQVLGGVLEDGGKNSLGKYIFNVVFNWRKINDKNATRSEDIVRNDWQYLLAPIGSSAAGWQIPVQCEGGQGGSSTQLVTEPFLYPYCEEDVDTYEDAFIRFLDRDYSGAELEP